MIRGGEPMEAGTRLASTSFRALSKSAVKAGIITQEQHDTVQRMLHDPNFSSLAAILFAALGRRPIAKDRT